MLYLYLVRGVSMENSTDSKAFLFNEFCRNKKFFELTHEFHTYMFVIDSPGSDLHDTKTIHIVLGEGFVYDYGDKNTCIEVGNFWEVMDRRMAKLPYDKMITNGDIIYFSNYIYKPTNQKVTHMVLTNPIGQNKSHVFYNDEDIYAGIKNFKPKDNPTCL